MISKDITKMIGEAMKARDEVRLSTLRMLSSEFNYEKIKVQHELTEEDEQNVIRKEARKRKDAIEAYTKAGAIDRVNLETKELEVLQEFLPPELPDDEVIKIIDESIKEVDAKGMQDMGKVISLVKSKASGVDGGKVAQIVREKLT
jgi:hypothetical protein